MKSVFVFGLLSVISFAAMAVDPTVDIHFAQETLKAVDVFRLSDTDQARVNYVQERLNFALDNLNKGYRENGSGSGTLEEKQACVHTLVNQAGVYASLAMNKCNQISSPKFYNCVVHMVTQASADRDSAMKFCAQGS